MFESLTMAPPDAILGLSEAFRGDPNPEKINLTVGVYKDPQGQTPILQCVKAAERRLLDEETSKGYLGIDGMPQYGERVRQLLFGAGHEIITSDRATTLQTPGGTGALRVAADLVKRQSPNAALWCSSPTWANHPSVFSSAGLEVKNYAYLDASGKALDIEAMIADLQTARPGDVICLHACCHNPTGVDPTPEQWVRIADALGERKLLPLIDFAYQGFGEGLTEDTRGLLEVSKRCRELLVCSSFSKNFGLYGERVGAMTIVASDSQAAKAAHSHAKACVRSNYSNPPKHGAAIVNIVLSDEPLRAQWEQELTQMRERICVMRRLFVETMQAKSPRHDFSFIGKQRGMFSYSGLSPVQVDELRGRYSIYIVGSGRMNIAGMSEANMDNLCQSIAAVL